MINCTEHFEIFVLICSYQFNFCTCGSNRYQWSVKFRSTSALTPIVAFGHKLYNITYLHGNSIIKQHTSRHKSARGRVLWGWREAIGNPCEEDWCNCSHLLTVRFTYQCRAGFRWASADEKARSSGWIVSTGQTLLNRKEYKSDNWTHFKKGFILNRAVVPFLIRQLKERRVTLTDSN